MLCFLTCMFFQIEPLRLNAASTRAPVPLLPVSAAATPSTRSEASSASTSTRATRGGSQIQRVNDFFILLRNKWQI